MPRYGSAARLGMVVVVVDPCPVVVVTTEVVVVEVVVVVGQTGSAPCRRQVRRTLRRHLSGRAGPTTQSRMAPSSTGVRA